MRALDDELYASFLGEIIVEESKRNYHYAIALYSAFLRDRGLCLEEVAPREIEVFARILWSEHRNSVAQVVFNVVKRLHAWVAENGIAPDVARNVNPRMSPTPYCRQAVSASQAEKILCAANAGRESALVNLMVRAAMKTGDIAGMRMNDIILASEGGEIRIKDGTWVPLTAKCSAALADYMADMGAAAHHPDEPLVPSRSTRSWGQPLSQRSIREILSSVCKRAGIPGEAGEYDIGSAALELALAEGEPVEVILSISDRTWLSRKSRAARRERSEVEGDFRKKRAAF